MEYLILLYEPYRGNWHEIDGFKTKEEAEEYADYSFVSGDMFVIGERRVK